MSLPESIHPDQMNADEEYVVVIHSTASEFNFVGPFRPTSSLLPITADYPFTGNFRVTGFFAESNEKISVLIPNGGRAIIFRMHFSLHSYTEALKEFIESVLLQKKAWMRTARGPDR